MNRAERRRQAQDDEKILARGIDARSRDPKFTLAMGRLLAAMFEQAKRAASIDLPVRYLGAKVDATVQALSDIPVACKKGCSHCCRIWISATAPEVLFIAKGLRRRADAAAAERIKAAHAQTGSLDHAARAQHRVPCPMLVDDACSIHPMRPITCRAFFSSDVAVCARAYHQVTNEDIPTPPPFVLARGTYAIALAIALRHAQLPHYSYELNGAVDRALEREDAERAWLSGEDVFAGLQREADQFAQAPTRALYERAFG